ncbi:hypothetical protein [Peribacillus simplex]|uniref:hypothetical protein n=1 Tax=Peribacillus simplex TaxID=1478 RepID=UPI0028535DA1|nr:hypothetical protein [Peribacillus simplex]MDR4928269.1 hypothetical protein [Peribacillus simplex]
MAEEDKKKKCVVLFKVFGVVVIILVIATPIILSVFMHAEIFSKALGDANGWLGYWGGYLGAIIGAITVFIATSLQLKSQKNLHKETLVVQKASIEESARLNDQQQREFTISNLRINKIDSLVQELLLLNLKNSERFNILRECNYYNHLVKVADEKIKKEIMLLKVEKIVEEGKVIKSTQSFKIPKEKLNNSNIKRKRRRIDIKKALEKRNENINLKYEYLEQETAKRNEIRVSSAKLKSEAMFVNGLDNELNAFRGYQSEVIDLFYNLNVKNNISKDEYDSLIEFHVDKFMRENNKAIWKCKQRLDKELLSFQKGNVTI